MKITLTDDYRLPTGKATSQVVAKLLSLQRKEVTEYAKSGRRSPVNFNGWVDYWTEKLLPYSMFNFAAGWKMQAGRLLRVEPKNKHVKALVKAGKKTKKDEEDEMLLYLGFAQLINPTLVAEVQARLRQTVAGINNTTAKLVNQAIARDRDEDIDDLLAELWDAFRPSRATLIGEDESVRSYHSGMVRMLGMSKYRWVKTWRTAADEIVCRICRPLDGVTIPLEDTFISIPKTGLDAGTPHLINHPPAHPGPCRCRLEMVAEVWPVAESRQGVMV